MCYFECPYCQGEYDGDEFGEHFNDTIIDCDCGEQFKLFVTICYEYSTQKYKKNCEHKNRKFLGHDYKLYKGAVRTWELFLCDDCGREFPVLKGVS